MHTIYHTEAIVVRSEPSGEANKRVWLFTRELGLVIAMVQGVRKSTAKLQSHVSDYSVVMADLIKGKSTWRLISSQVIAAPVKGSTRAPTARAYVRTVTFLERFLVGEGIHEELFEHVVEMANIIKKEHIEARFLDALSLWKMLALLGYIAIEEKDQALFSLPLSEAVDAMTESKMKELIKNATEAIISSHL